MLLLSLSDCSRFGLEEAVPGRRWLLRSEGSGNVVLRCLDIKYNFHSGFLDFRCEFDDATAQAAQHNHTALQVDKCLLSLNNFLSSPLPLLKQENPSID